MSQSDYSPRQDPKKIIAVVLIVVVIGVSVYGILTWPKPKFRVYTYDSFMAWGPNPDEIDDEVFSAFEEEHGIDVQIERLQTDASGIISRLIAERENPVADVVIGIDNILILREDAKTVLEPYTPPNLDEALANTSLDLVDALDPEHYVVPFDYGLVTLIYDMQEMNVTTHPQLENLTFSNLAEMASSLVTENPQMSSPGLSFLLSEIAVEEKLNEEDWTNWWNQVRNDIDVQEGWSEAWSKWDSDESRSLLVSYGTDPAYSAYMSGSEPSTGVAPIVHNNQEYAWVQIEGMGIVKGGPHPDLAREFIQYCLTGKVQSHVAVNQWMYPVNGSVELDPAFQYALHPNEINMLNNLLSKNETATNLESWLDEWESIMTAA
ncbi:MAG: thiamine ABC transporter substrate-binding protein [Candidatus Lokiarchaeota archaeon]|nr:thiamine ABC transporter substrate-binding protein [Candidatus Lokiarchaeota archaeon]